MSQVVSIIEEGWNETSTGPCLSCLMEDELNQYDLCGACTPADPVHRRALVALLKQTKGVQAPGDN